MAAPNPSSVQPTVEEFAIAEGRQKDLAGLLGRLGLEPLVNDWGILGQGNAVQVNDLAINDQLDVGRVHPAFSRIVGYARDRRFRSGRVIGLTERRTVDDDTRFGVIAKKEVLATHQ